MEKVQILMSTYNGEKYLEEQLDSILNQTYADIEILVRDDGSSDGTVAILQKYADEYENVAFYTGTNVGTIGSFFDVLCMSDDRAVFFAFADQDDVWLPEKIERAVMTLKKRNAEVPLLYCSDTYLTDAHLNIIKKDDKMPRPSWGNALVQNICTGCTAVINKRLRDIVKNTRPKQIVMHDWWLYLTAELYGEVVYDNGAYIKYRQHGNNVHGAKTSKLDVWKYRFAQLKEKRGDLYPQLREVKKWYADIDGEKEKMLESVLAAERGIGNRIKLGLKREIYRNSRVDDLVYRGIMLVGKL